MTMPDGEKNGNPRKLKDDENNIFHIKHPNGEEEAIKLTDSEIYTLENWFHLLGKHKLRMEIMNILQIYGEINITQLSRKVEQSKSTVARHLNSLEKHGIVISREATDKETSAGKIPPKLYRRNLKLLRILQTFVSYVPEPHEHEQLRDFYQREIESFRSVIFYFEYLLEKLHPLFDKFESQLDDLPKAREIWLKYIDEEESPAFLGLDARSFNEKYFDQVMEAYKKFMHKFTEILTIQNADPDVKERNLTALFAFLPVKDMFEIYKEEFLKKKKKNQKKKI